MAQTKIRRVILPRHDRSQPRSREQTQSKLIRKGPQNIDYLHHAVHTPQRLSRLLKNFRGVIPRAAAAGGTRLLPANGTKCNPSDVAVIFGRLGGNEECQLFFSRLLENCPQRKIASIGVGCGDSLNVRLVRMLLKESCNAVDDFIQRREQDESRSTSRVFRRRGRGASCPRSRARRPGHRERIRWEMSCQCAP